MKKLSVTDSQFLALFELSMDAEDRCIARYEIAQRRGDHNAAAHEAQLREHYRVLKFRLFECMEDKKPSLSLEEIATRMRALAEPLIGNARSGSDGRAV